MLFNMDPELCCELWQADVLKGSGYHEEEMETVSVGCVIKARMPSIALSPPDVTKSPIELSAAIYQIDFIFFNCVDCAKWDLISSRREYTLPKSISVTAPLTARTARIPSSTTPSVPSDSGPWITMITKLKRKYLDTNDGCFKCRRLKVFHKTPTCTNRFAKAPFVVRTSWDEATNTVIMPVVTGLCTPNLQAHAMQDSGYLSEDTALASELDEEECVELHFPPLSIELIGSQRNIQTLALADTGASSPFLSGRIVNALGVTSSITTHCTRALSYDVDMLMHQCARL
jgi:hypothetical protein